MLAERKETKFVERVERASRSRFAERPLYNIGDVLQPTEPVIEGVWTINGRTIIDTSIDVADADTPMIDASYIVRQPGRAWYILFLNPSSPSASKARKYMARKGCLAYWPREVVPVVRGRGEDRKLVPLVRPLFPSYALLHVPRVTAPEDLVTGPEAWANGISGFVTIARNPVVVPDVLVEDLVVRERQGEFVHVERRSSTVIHRVDWLVEGGLVLLNAGPFRDFTGLIEEIDWEHQRLKVAVEIFGRATPVELDVADVREPC